MGNTTSATSVSMSITTGYVPMLHHTHTWAEAVAIANIAAKSVGLYDRVTVRRDGERWAVRWRARPITVNYS